MEEAAVSHPSSNVESQHLEQELTRLRAATWKYGKHLASCTIYRARKCDCGWEEVRETLTGDALEPTERQHLVAEIERLRAQVEALKSVSGMDSVRIATLARLLDEARMDQDFRDRRAGLR